MGLRPHRKSRVDDGMTALAGGFNLCARKPIRRPLLEKQARSDQAQFDRISAGSSESVVHVTADLLKVWYMSAAPIRNGIKPMPQVSMPYLGLFPQ